MVGVFVDHDGVIVPVPIADVVEVIWRDTEIKIVEPETIAISPAKTVLMAAAETAREAAVFPWMIKVIVFVTASAIVAHPGVVVVDVRCFRMLGAIAEGTTILLAAIVLLGAIVLRASFLRTAFLRASFLRVAFLRAILLRPCCWCPIF
jgi:hypothetical protein